MDKGLVADSNSLAVAQNVGRAAGYAHGSQRSDEGLQIEQGNKGGVNRTDQTSHQHSDKDCQRNGHTHTNQNCRQNASAGRHRAGGQVVLTCNNQVSFADGYKTGHRTSDKDIGQVAVT